MVPSIALNGAAPVSPTVPLSVGFSIPNVLHTNRFAYIHGYGQRIEVDSPDTFTLDQWLVLIKEKLSPDEDGYFLDSFVKINMKNNKLDAFPKFLTALAIVFQEMIPKEPNVTVEVDETVGVIDANSRSELRELLLKFLREE